MNKREALAELGRKRRVATAPGLHLNLSQVKNGVYDCDLVSPREKWSGNADSEILVFLRDWWEADKLEAAKGTVHEELLEKGIVENLNTNVKLQTNLQRLGISSARDVYATNIFPWARVGEATYAQQRMGAIDYGLTMIEILNPKLVIAMGPDIYRALHEAALGTKPRPGIEQIVNCPFQIGASWIFGQSHPASRGSAREKDRNWDKLAKFWEEIR